MAIFFALVLDEVITWVSSAHPPVDSAVTLLTAMLTGATHSVTQKCLLDFQEAMTRLPDR